MSKCLYYPSPNEIERLKRVELDKRKKLRLQQVRELARINAAQIRQKGRERREEVIEQIAQEEQENLEAEEDKEFKVLEDRYQNCISTLGESHTHALEWEDPAQQAAVLSDQNHLVANERFRLALDQLRDMRELEETEKNSRQHCRDHALLVEKQRALLVAGLPSPPPDPLFSAQQKGESSGPCVTVFDQKAVSTSHVSADKLVSVKRAPSPNEQQVDAFDAARDAGDQWEQQNQATSRQREDCLVKAQVRGKEAFRKEAVRQSYEQMVEELATLHRGDLSRRQKGYNTIPKQIFAVPHRLTEESRAAERARERAFESTVIQAAAASTANNNLVHTMSLIGPAANHDLIAPAAGPNVVGPERGFQLYDDSWPRPSTLPLIEERDESPVHAIGQPLSSAGPQQQNEGPLKVASGQTLDKLFARIKVQRDQWLSQGGCNQEADKEKAVPTSQKPRTVKVLGPGDKESELQPGQRGPLTSLENLRRLRPAHVHLEKSEILNKEAERRSRHAEELLNKAQMERKKQELEDEMLELDARIKTVRERGPSSTHPFQSDMKWYPPSDAVTHFDSLRPGYPVIGGEPTPAVVRARPSRFPVGRDRELESEALVAREVDRARRDMANRVGTSSVPRREDQENSGIQAVEKDSLDDGRLSTYSEISTASEDSLARIRAYQDRLMERLHGYSGEVSSNSSTTVSECDSDKYRQPRTHSSVVDKQCKPGRVKKIRRNEEESDNQHAEMDDLVQKCSKSSHFKDSQKYSDVRPARDYAPSKDSSLRALRHRQSDFTHNSRMVSDFYPDQRVDEFDHRTKRGTVTVVGQRVGAVDSGHGNGAIDSRERFGDIDSYQIVGAVDSGHGNGAIDSRERFGDIDSYQRVGAVDSGHGNGAIDSRERFGDIDSYQRVGAVDSGHGNGAIDSRERFGDIDSYQRVGAVDSGHGNSDHGIGTIDASQVAWTMPSNDDNNDYQSTTERNNDRERFIFVEVDTEEKENDESYHHEQTSQILDAKEDAEDHNDVTVAVNNNTRDSSFDLQEEASVDSPDRKEREYDNVNEETLCSIPEDNAAKASFSSLERPSDVQRRSLSSLDQFHTSHLVHSSPLQPLEQEVKAPIIPSSVQELKTLLMQQYFSEQGARRLMELETPEAQLKDSSIPKQSSISIQPVVEPSAESFASVSQRVDSSLEQGGHGPSFSQPQSGNTGSLTQFAESTSCNTNEIRESLNGVLLTQYSDPDSSRIIEQGGEFPIGGAKDEVSLSQYPETVSSRVTEKNDEFPIGGSKDEASLSQHPETASSTLGRRNDEFPIGGAGDEVTFTQLSETVSSKVTEQYDKFSMDRGQLETIQASKDKEEDNECFIEAFNDECSLTQYTASISSKDPDRPTQFDVEGSVNTTLTQCPVSSSARIYPRINSNERFESDTASLSQHPVSVSSSTNMRNEEAGRVLQVVFLSQYTDSSSSKKTPTVGSDVEKSLSLAAYRNNVQDNDQFRSHNCNPSNIESYPSIEELRAEQLLIEARQLRETARHEVYFFSPQLPLDNLSEPGIEDEPDLSLVAASSVQSLTSMLGTLPTCPARSDSLLSFQEHEVTVASSPPYSSAPASDLQTAFLRANSSQTIKQRHQALLTAKLNPKPASNIGRKVPTSSNRGKKPAGQKRPTEETSREVLGNDAVQLKKTLSDWRKSRQHRWDSQPAANPTSTTNVVPPLELESLKDTQDQVVTVTSEDRRNLEKDAVDRTKRLWSQLEEVKVRRGVEHRQQEKTANREKAKEYAKNVRGNLMSNPSNGSKSQ